MITETIKPGYKQTEVGIIPEDWNIKKVREFSYVVRGGSPRPAGDPKYFNGNFIPWLTVAALTNIPSSQIDVSETVGFLTEEGSKLSRILEKGTIIIANSGATLGVAKILDIKCCANDGIAALLNVSLKINKKFVVYKINAITRRLREVIAPGVGQPNLNTELIGDIPIAFPPTTEEQTVIVQVLSDTDALIVSIDKLITKKKNLKQGAMEKLLTGKKRLPGFDRTWETKCLGKIVDIRKGQLITENTCKPGDIPVIAGGKTPAYYHNKPNRLKKTITISASGAYAGYVSFHKNPIFASDCSTIEEGTDYSIEFIHFQLQRFQSRIYKLQTGGAQPHVHPRDLKPLELPFPKDPKEQSAIAQVLSDMDAEIEELEQKRDKYLNIKKGMMQQLLTGGIRLKCH